MSQLAKLREFRGTQIKPTYQTEKPKEDPRYEPMIAKTEKQEFKPFTPSLPFVPTVQPKKQEMPTFAKTTNDRGTQSIRESVYRDRATEAIKEAKVEKKVKATSKENAARIEKEMEDKYGINIRKTYSPMDYQLMIGKLNLDEQGKKEFDKLYTDYLFNKERSKPFAPAAEAAFNVLPTMTESVGKNDERFREIEATKEYGMGRFVGGAGQQLAFGSVLGTPIEGLVSKFLPKATPFVAETIKDVAIGTGTQLAEAPFDKPTATQFVGNMAMDIALNALFSAVGKGLSKIDLTGIKTAKPQGVVQEVAKQMDINESQANDLIDRSIDTYLNTIRTTQPTVEPRMVGTNQEVPSFTPTQSTVESVFSKPKSEIKPELPKIKSIVEEIDQTIEPPDVPLKKFRLDLFGASPEKPVKVELDGTDVDVVKTVKQNGKEISTLADGSTVETSKLKMKKDYKPKTDLNIGKVIDNASTYKDVGPTERWTTDVFRQVKKVFGNDASVIKKSILDPFDAAKGTMADDMKRYSDDLYENVVKKLDIKKGSKESALVMKLGEGKITDVELVTQVGKDKAEKIIKANEWFKDRYDTLLKEINDSRVATGLDPIPRRENYYRHYLEMAEGVRGLKNIFESPSLISPSLEGVSEFTKPKEMWMGIKQKFTGAGDYTEDAVGGFLDYIRSGSYAKNIDPHIQNFRQLRNQLANATEDSKNINNFVGFLDEYANNLAGKTNKFDRTIQDLMGRKAFRVLNWANSRVKANAVLGNMSSALSQIANVPQAIATVKNPITLTKGFNGMAKSVLGGGDIDLYKQSSFLKERYVGDVFNKFDTKMLDQPKKFAKFMLEALDQVGTRFTWSSVYRQGLEQGVENPIKYADDITRNLIAGRGIGEVPTLQQSKLFQMIAPFTLEVNNMWKVQKDFLKAKDFIGLTTLYVANHVLNNVMEEVRGSDVVFDPIQAIVDGVTTEGTYGDKFASTVGSLSGEILMNVPLGSSIAAAYPEYGMRVGGLELPTRSELFKEYDPTRYGISMPIVKAAQDPIKNLLLPYGGAQVAKTIQGAKTVGLLPQNLITDKDTVTKENIAASVTPTGKIRTFVEPTPLKTAQALAFGGYASPEVREFFKSGTPVFGEQQTPDLISLVNKGYNPKKLDEAIKTIRTSELTKKQEQLMSLVKSGYSSRDALEIWNTMFSKKKGD